MRLNKRQAIVLLTQFGVIIALCAGLLITFLVRGPVKNASTEPYEKIRSARVSLSPSLDWETNIGGSGEDTLCASYYSGGKLYVFGSAEKDDYDMAGTGESFMAVLSQDGKTEGFYPLNCGKAEKVLPHERGFIAAGNTETGIRITVISPDGTEAAGKDFAGEDLTVADLIMDSSVTGAYILILNNPNTGLGKNELKAIRYRADGRSNEERDFALSYNLKYMNSFAFGNGSFVTAVCAEGSTESFISLVSWTFTSTPVFHNITIENSYTGLAAVPHGGGYLALIADGEKKQVNLLSINAQFEKTNKLYLGGENASSGTIFSDGQSNYYIWYNCGGDRSYAFKYDGNDTKNHPLAALSNLTAVYKTLALSGSAAIVGCDLKQTRTLLIEGGEVTENVSYGGAPATNAALVRAGTKLLAVCEMNKKTKDCPALFGKSDLWICRLKI